MDKFLYGCIYLSAAIAVSVLLMIICYVAVRGIGSVSLEFLTTVTSARKGTVGIAGNIVNTLYIIVITLVIATPIGVGSAIYLNEYAKPGKVVRIIEFTTETLSGIPSIIFGLFGSVFFGFGFSPCFFGCAHETRRKLCVRFRILTGAEHLAWEQQNGT